jgi:hypothetical protein
VAYDNNNSGVLFKNDKENIPGNPTHTGNITVDRTDCWFNGWKKPDGSITLLVKSKASESDAGEGALRPKGNNLWDISLKFRGVEYEGAGQTRIGKPSSKIPGVAFLSVKFKKKEPPAGDFTAQPPADGSIDF